MNKGIIVTLIVITSILAIIYLTILNSTSIWSALAIGLLINIVSGPIYFAIVEGLYNLKNFKLFWKSYIKYRKSDVRFSISYIFRIPVKDKYLLVKNRKYNYYQPVGGAYKTLPGVEVVFKKLGIVTDNKFETSHGIAKNDLRFRVKGKRVLDVIKWFNSKENREISQWREFCEELLTTDIIQNKHAFRYIDYEYVTTLITPMQKAKKLDCQEILIYEIFDLVPNNDQIIELERLLEIGDTNEIKFADSTLISRLGFDERSKEVIYDIAPHTKWAHFEKYSEE
ncbi:hypothetical protein FUA48_05840 [Flavobacterium alkalisoli]|uniref:CD-NTase-associated protein 16 NUDIX domain-containing protein n=1 Tax=Flavobacterium alkalisoli TaxID=2602769 RepID=A0A5B9FU09_9FLAO|nr:hypothetical protein [Flavobacterium alkalisoli]QEE49118.1 hypothetical protein FUA48_05840 [Flavobacterium alkalisoli]